MDLYHQTGHNFIWNIDSLEQDRAGNGLIVSPVNIPLDRVSNLSNSLKAESLFDPQFYLPKDLKGQLTTYNFFPAKLREGLQSIDLEDLKNEIAKGCVKFQVENGFKRILIPTRYFDELPSNYYQDLEDFFVNPFLQQAKSFGSIEKVSITVVIKPVQLTDPDKRAEVLNWLTGLNGINGVYLIFQNNAPSKQIKDSQFLAGALLFILALKANGLHVVIGYTNTEGLLYSLANPDGIAMGVYENLRNFNPGRFEEGRQGPPRGPNPRLYIGRLLQWVEYGFIRPLQELYPGFGDLVEDSQYRPLMFAPDFQWHFQKPELYKHFFLVFSQQIQSLNEDLPDRKEQITKLIQEAMEHFESIRNYIALDGDSDGSHLPHWVNAINLYDKHRKEIGL